VHSRASSRLDSQVNKAVVIATTEVLTNSPTHHARYRNSKSTEHGGIRACLEVSVEDKVDEVEYRRRDKVNEG